MMESLEDVGASLAADSQPAEAAEPGQGALHDPAMASQALAALDAAPGNAVAYPPLAQGTTAARLVIGCVGMEFVRALTGAASALMDRRHGVDQRVEDAAVVDI